MMWNFAVGADGVIFAIPEINGTNYTMKIFNSDGSKPEMCGNRVGCFARLIAELENLQGTHSFTEHTSVGLIVLEIQDDGKVKVGKGEPILKASDVSTKLPPNNNQSVVKSDLNADGVIWNVTCATRTNTEFVEVFSRSHLKMHVSEHESIATLAGGTGAYAVVIAAVLIGRAGRVSIGRDV
ncbi:hypothetical protein CRYUN_Cryun41cG0044400 [Craigia yunnanensis]